MSHEQLLDQVRPFSGPGAGAADLKWRRQQLENLRQALVDERDTMVAALATDLAVDSAQATLLQISSIFAEIDICLNGLDEWNAPQYVPTPIVLQPATSYVQPQPKGVVLILGAWNYPFNLCFGPVAVALAAGNCIVLKPSELSPCCASVIERICRERLDPRGVRCVTGGAEVASTLVKQPFDHIFYTGGPRVAKLVLAAAAPNLTPVTCELGGKSPCIITKGTNIGEACRRIATHKFTNTGQTCIAPDYVLVENGVRDEFVSKFVSIVQNMFGDSPETLEHLGRLVNAAAADRLCSYLDENHGGKVVYGKSKPTEPVREGHRYVPPTIVLDPSKDSRLLNEEMFGPVLSIVTVASWEEAVAIVNSKPKPLALYVFAPNQIATKVIDRTSSGGVVIGDAVVHKGNEHLPFGGVGNSGMGKTHGIHGFRELSNMRAVMNRPLYMPAALALPVDRNISNFAWMYASKRPMLHLRRQFWKILIAVVALFVARRRLRR